MRRRSEDMVLWLRRHHSLQDGPEVARECRGKIFICQEILFHFFYSLARASETIPGSYQ